MIRIVTFVVFFLSFANANALGVFGPCKINFMNLSGAYPNYMLVEMQCTGSNLPTNCNNIESKFVTYEAHTDIGKSKTSILLAAFMADRNVRISTLDSCPAEINNVAEIWGITVY